MATTRRTVTDGESGFQDEAHLEGRDFAVAFDHERRSGASRDQLVVAALHDSDRADVPDRARIATHEATESAGPPLENTRDRFHPYV